MFAAIERECATSDELRCEVVTLYRGGKYDLYRYRRLQDVRLVFAPEFDTGFFGGDPDNFMFPRFNLDLAFVRVYERDAPAKAEPVVTVVAKWRRARRSGLRHGTPRRHIAAVHGGAARVRARPAAADASHVLQRGARTAHRVPAARVRRSARLADAELVFVENSLKVFRGQFAALADRSLLERKRADEAALGPRSRAASCSSGSAARGTRSPLRPRHDATSGLASRRSRGSPDRELFSQAQTLVRLAAEQAKPNEQRLPEFSEAALPARPAADRGARGLTERARDGRPRPRPHAHSRAARPRRPGNEGAARHAIARRGRFIGAIAGTTLGEAERTRRADERGRGGVAASTDPLIVLARAVDPLAREARKQLEDEVDAVVDRNTELIAQALFAVRGDRVYPDATFTLRVTYGTVKGWTEGGREVTPFTTIGGLYNRHTGSPPFELPAAVARPKTTRLARHAVQPRRRHRHHRRQLRLAHDRPRRPHRRPRLRRQHPLDRR